MTLNLVFKARFIVAIRLGSGLFSSLIMFLINLIASFPRRVGVACIGFAIHDLNWTEYIIVAMNYCKIFGIFLVSFVKEHSFILRTDIQ